MPNASYDLETVTFNVRGLHIFFKRKDIFHLLRRERSDITCLQELYIAAGEDSVAKFKKIVWESKPNRGCSYILKKMKLHPRDSFDAFKSLTR